MVFERKKLPLNNLKQPVLEFNH